MTGVLVVLEQRTREGRPAWSRMSWEALAAGHELAARLAQPLLRRSRRAVRSMG